MKMENFNATAEPSSFRDPSGTVYVKNDEVFRSVNYSYKENYDFFKSSGLKKFLIENQLIVDFTEIDSGNSKFYKILKPKYIDFISYPYEWCFSQLKDAAIKTIEIQIASLEHGMALKDASAYNIQFVDGSPTLIDILSFEIYEEGRPWIAYKQFCQHFLAPLILMSQTDIRLNNLSKLYIDGIPLDLASKLLPKKTWLNLKTLTHIHLHAIFQGKYSDSAIKEKKPSASKNISKEVLLEITNNLLDFVKKIKITNQKTEWGDYYSETNYSENSFNEKEKLVYSLLSIINPYSVWDLGANNGNFSRISSKMDINTVSFDIDPIAVEKNYLHSKNYLDKKLLPILMDLTNPSPSIGWANSERMSFLHRGKADCVLALALIHHLAISNNIPLSHISCFLKDICNSLIIEFVPKNDSQVKRLLATRIDIFENYDEENFEYEFSKNFKIISKHKIQDSERVIYRMKRID